MKLAEVIIRAFKSIKEEVRLAVDGKITVLIGANDNGKTNILSAILCANDDSPIQEGDRNWDVNDPQGPSIEWVFRLDEGERQSLFQAIVDETRSAIEEARSAFVESEFDFIERSAHLVELLPSESPEAQVAKTQEHRLHIPDRVIFVREGVGAPVRLKSPELSLFPEIAEKLRRARPRVELFKSTEQLMDKVSLSELENSSQEFMQGIFRYAGLWDSRQDLFNQNPSSARWLETGSVKFTERIRAEWQQGENLTFRLIHSGQNGSHVELMIEDPSVERRYVRPSERSEGFSAFFKMSMRMLARTEANKANSHIFLFDEPGTALHPSGQVNLQRVFERLALDDQIIYSTHSLFMVNHNRPERNRVVSKSTKGTELDQKPFHRNWRAVRQTLGLVLAGTFFIADRTLLVEGESDALYLGALLSAFDRAEAMDVDLNLFSVQWAGNARDFEPMARLLAEEGREVVAMIDGDKGGKDLRGAIEKLNKRIAEGLTGCSKPVMLVELPPRNSIEDLLPHRNEYYNAVLNAAEELVAAGFRKFANEQLTREERLAQLSADKGTRTLGKHVELVTKDWFAEKEALSKLLIARHYCAWVEENGVGGLQPPPNLVSVASALKLEKKVSEKQVLEAPVQIAAATAV